MVTSNVVESTAAVEELAPVVEATEVDCATASDEVVVKNVESVVVVVVEASSVVTDAVEPSGMRYTSTWAANREEPGIVTASDEIGLRMQVDHIADRRFQSTMKRTPNMTGLKGFVPVRVCITQSLMEL